MRKFKIGVMTDSFRTDFVSALDSAAGLGAQGETLILNANNELVQFVLNNEENENTELICQQLYDLAQLANHPLKPEEMTKFVARSNKILGILAK